MIMKLLLDWTPIITKTSKCRIMKLWHALIDLLSHPDSSFYDTKKISFKDRYGLWWNFIRDYYGSQKNINLYFEPPIVFAKR